MAVGRSLPAVKGPGSESGATERALVLFYTDCCNIACAHCIVRSGPKTGSKLEWGSAERAIRSASQAGMARLVFSGGENLLHESEVLGLCELAKSVGMATRIFTNGSWARGVEQAESTLSRLAAGGVDELVISIDEFHLPLLGSRVVDSIRSALRAIESPPFIYFQTVIANVPESLAPVDDGRGRRWPAGVLHILRLYGVSVQDCLPLAEASVRVAGLGDGEGLASLRQLARDHLVLEWLPVFVGGRALEEWPRELAPPIFEAGLGGPCLAVGRHITVRGHGGVYPCCSSWTNFRSHELGRMAGDVEWGALLQEIDDDPLVRVIRDYGPGAVLRALDDRGLEISGRYTDICNMCEDLFQRFSPAVLREAATSHLQTEMLTWLVRGGHDGGHATSVADPIETAKTDS